RRQLLAQFGIDFEVRPADADETPLPGEHPACYVERVARDKAVAVALPGELVIAADTTVDVDGEILGKPEDDADALRMLRRLSGREHEVHTGLALLLDGRLACAVETTVVTMAQIGDAELDWYLSTGEPVDKAGAYALQGFGGVFITSVTGSVSNVIGLPLSAVKKLCRENFLEDFFSPLDG
ncbi:MAG: nucleoside triphosphate pyrophosphatase, partial [Microbacteriaceae bacterium]